MKIKTCDRCGVSARMMMEIHECKDGMGKNREMKRLCLVCAELVIG